MPLWLDYILRVSIGNVYIVYFRSALQMAIEDCALFQKTSDRVDGVCLATNELNDNLDFLGNWAWQDPFSQGLSRQGGLQDLLRAKKRLQGFSQG